MPVSNSSLGGSRQSSMALSAALFAQLSSKEMCKMQLCTILLFYMLLFCYYSNLHATVLIYMQLFYFTCYYSATILITCCYYSKSVVDFFDVSRVHLKQELLEPEDEFSSLQMASFIVMPSSVLKAWYELSSELI